MKAIWKGSIGFGLVNIPVKLYSATQSSTLDLDMLDKRDFGKIRFQRVNENTGKEVTWENIIRGYMLKDEYIPLDKKDFEEVAPEKSKSIDINNFVDEAEIDSIYFENAYYLQPEKSGVRAYALLREALAKSGKVGIGQFVLRTTETLAVLKPMDDILVLCKIRFAEEIRSTDEFTLPAKSVVKPTEMKMALALIRQFSGPFKIEKFKDEYAAGLLKLIKAKASGKHKPIRKLKVAKSRSEDLMTQLKASLGSKKVS